MTSTKRKNYQSFSNSWLSAVKFVEKRQISVLAPTNPDLYHYAANNPVRYVDPDGEITITPNMLRAAAWGIRIGTVIEDAATFGAGVADDIPTLAFAESLMITATLMEVASNAESQVANNLKSNAQSPTTAAGSPSPNDDNEDDKDSYDDKNEVSNDDNNFNFTKREKNEAKHQFSSNKKFRDYFHREYKPSEKHNVNGKNNPDLRDEQITEAYKE